MTLEASSSGAMIGDRDNTKSIPAYAPATPSIPDMGFLVPANSARFGYTVMASTSAEATPWFQNNGSACNAGATNDGSHCWLNASTTAFYIMNTTGATAASGSTSTLIFHVKINPNPAPMIPDDMYVATTTLTALVK